MKLKRHSTLSLLFLTTLGVACSSTPDDTSNDNGDSDGDAVLDSLGKSIDANGDGIADEVDLDGDGMLDGVGIDTNDDGVADAIGYDTDGDGIIDAIDTDLDGIPDPVNPGTGGGNPGTGGGEPGTGGGEPGTGGGEPGTGGEPGSGGDPGTGGGGTTGNGCASADIFCEDFEAVATGMIPSGAGWSTRDASCGSMSFSMGVADDNPRGSSTKALKITNHSYAQCRLSRAFDTLDEFWVTAHVYWDPSVAFDSKEILALDLHPDSGAGKDDPAVRFGNRSKEPCTANPGPQITMIGLGGGEVTGCNDAVPIPKGEWYCFEAHVRQPDSLTVKTYINSTELMYQSSGKPLVSELVSAAVPSEKVNNLRLGMFTHNSSGSGDVYVDDVSVSTTRVGCN